MKIKLIHYPYDKYQIGDYCDFGEEKNASLVSMDRAVWIEKPETKPNIFTEMATQKKMLTNRLREKVIQTKAEIAADLTPQKPTSKKLLQNDLRAQVQSAKNSTKKKSIHRNEDI